MVTLGIDLGTTNSLAAYWDDGEAKLIPNSLGKELTPSVIGLDDDNQIVVGELAKQRLQIRPDKTVANFKRYMGTNKTLTIGKKKFRPEELSALVLKSLKADAEAYLKTEINDAVISVPAYFSDAQRKATQAAGRLAGLNVLRLINEPTAAAIAYGFDQSEDANILVFDIGGGTFDVSILELFDGVMQINASSGDNLLGGEDFTDVLVRYFADFNRIKLAKLKGDQLATLRKSAEACKRDLTNNSIATMTCTLKNKTISSEISREQFVEFSQHLLERLRKPLERALNDSDIHSEELNTVVLVGGASRMPVIRSLASRMLGAIPSAHINPDTIVALGTALQVGLMQNDKALKEIVLTDVSPYTLGINVHNENSFDENATLFHPIIERNSPVPISRSDIFYTVFDNQTTIEVGIFQGESRLARDNSKLGQLNLTVPPGKAGKENIEVRFTYDINGLLEVEATVRSSGINQSVVIEGNPGLMSEQEIQKRLTALSDLKVHPRDKMENAVLMARGERLFEESLGDKRAYIADIITQFESILNRQDPNEIAEAVSSINAIFDELESGSPLL